MKRLKFLLVAALGGFLFAQCGHGSVEAPLKGISSSQVDSVSYAVGVSIGSMIKQNNLGEINIDKFAEGVKHTLSKGADMNEQRSVGMIINNYLEKKMALLGETKKAEQTAFMAENKNNEGVVETESGLQYQIVNPGSEIKAIAVDTVEVNYKGTLLDGTVFDSSYDRGESIKFPLNAVIAGWGEGIQLIGEGGKINLWIPYELAYGERAAGADIPAYSTLYFEVELLKVYKYQDKKAKKSK